MSTEQFIVVAKRFFRGFIAGGVASAAALLAAGATLNTWDDLRQLSIAVATAFISGGLLAIDKMFRWTDEPER